MKYDARACHFNMDTSCVELLLRDGRMISIDCTGVEDALDMTMAQQTERDYLIYSDPLGYADLILNSDPEGYLKNVTGSHGLEDSEKCRSKSNWNGISYLSIFSIFCPRSSCRMARNRSGTSASVIAPGTSTVPAALAAS